ncbi:MAG: hypothetical protein ACLRFM_00460 [Alphaproteobacteria bacterium]
MAKNWRFRTFCGIMFRMKTESYKKAIDKIHDIVGQAVTRQIPTLDYIMGVEKMSETDKVWYEAYKKYGNRNHTWQDFKDMFYGDMQTMKKTVVNWKTWDEINDLLSQSDVLRTEVRKLLGKYDIRSIDKEKTEEYELIKKEHPDLAVFYEKYLTVNDLAYSNYSTFNPQVAKLEKEFEIKSKAINPDDKKSKIDLIVEYLKKMDEYVDLKNGDFVLGERIEMYRKIILKDSTILMMIQNFDNLSGAEKVDLARMILNKSAKIAGTPTGRVIHDDATDGPHVLRKHQGGGYDKKGERFLFRGDVSNFSKLWNFLKTLAHEDAHRIDDYNAEYGMIGTQLMKFVENNYLNNSDIDEELYRKFATEQSSYYLDETIGAALKYEIEHQNS